MNAHQRRVWNRHYARAMKVWKQLAQEAEKPKRRRPASLYEQELEKFWNTGTKPAWIAFAIPRCPNFDRTERRRR